MNPVPLLSGCIWGPLANPRFGQILWVNPLPTAYKLCSFNCLYCRFGASDKVVTDVTPYIGDIPSANKILAEVEKMLRKGVEFDTIALSGNGEPTLHPEFPKLVHGIRKILKEKKINKTYALISNSSILVKDEIMTLVDEFDLPIFKLDSGRQETFERVNRPAPGIKYSKIVEQLEKIGPNIHLQTVFLAGPRGNLNATDIRLWIQVVRQIKPKVVEIYSINREFPGMGIEMVPLVILEELARKAEKNTGVKVVPYGNWR